MKLRDAHWSVYFAAWVLGIVASGAVLGALVFLLAGPAWDATSTPLARALEGARRVGFIFFIWAPGIGLAASVMRSYRRKHGGPRQI